MTTFDQVLSIVGTIFAVWLLWGCFFYQNSRAVTPNDGREPYELRDR